MSFLDDLFSSSTTTTDRRDPYAPVAPYLNSLIANLGNAPTMQAYDGQYFADMNPMFRQALTDMFQNPAGRAFAERMSGQFGSDLAEMGLDGFTDALTTMRNRGPRQFEFDAGTADTIMDRFMPGLTGAVERNGVLTSRQLDSDLAQLRAAGGGGGNTRTGQQSALAQALAAERQDDFVLDAFGAASGAANNAGMSAGTMNLNQGNLFDNQIMGGFSDLMRTGINGMITGNNANNLNMELARGAGNAFQAFDQGVLDAERQQFMDSQSIPINDMLTRLNAMTNVGNMFGEQTTTTTQNPSTFSNLANLAGTAMNIAGFAGGNGWLGSSFQNMLNPFGAGGAPTGAAMPLNLPAMDFSNYDPAGVNQYLATLGR